MSQAIFIDTIVDSLAPMSPNGTGIPALTLGTPSRTWDADTPAALEFATSRSDRQREHMWGNVPTSYTKAALQAGNCVAQNKDLGSKASNVDSGEVPCRCPAMCDAGRVDEVSGRSWQSE